jgi:hypothetical protein
MIIFYEIINFTTKNKFLKSNWFFIDIYQKMIIIINNYYKYNLKIILFYNILTNSNIKIFQQQI